LASMERQIDCLSFPDVCDTDDLSVLPYSEEAQKARYQEFDTSLGQLLVISQKIQAYSIYLSELATLGAKYLFYITGNNKDSVHTVNEDETIINNTNNDGETAINNTKGEP